MLARHTCLASDVETYSPIVKQQQLRYVSLLQVLLLLCEAPIRTRAPFVLGILQGFEDGGRNILAPARVVRLEPLEETVVSEPRHLLLRHLSRGGLGVLYHLLQCAHKCLLICPIQRIVGEKVQCLPVANAPGSAAAVGHHTGVQQRMRLRQDPVHHHLLHPHVDAPAQLNPGPVQKETPEVVVQLGRVGLQPRQRCACDADDLQHPHQSVEVIAALLQPLR
mmetsp:Transcript_25534/g.65781  ORF Transcript_25534/g.65781 Transcript_25534/m.65781 type:complete len:222 (+) Transcript_25534:524-1189(+)